MRAIINFVLVILAGAGLGLLAVYMLPSCSSTTPSYVRARHPAAASSTLGVAPASMTDAACLDLMEKRDDSLLAAKILGGLGGLDALSTPIVDMEDDRKERNVQWCIVAGAGALSAVSVATLWYGERKGAEFEKYCEVTEMAPSPFEGDAGAP